LRYILVTLKLTFVALQISFSIVVTLSCSSWMSLLDVVWRAWTFWSWNVVSSRA